MSILENLKKELEIVENEISKKEITEELYNLINLFNKRILLGNKISQYNWDKLDLSEKESKRESDFNLTKAYFEKFQNEVSNKYHYKKEYINFYFEIKKLILLDSPNKLFYTVILEIINSKEYLNLSKEICICSIIEHLESSAPNEVYSLVKIYNKLIKIPFELKK